MQSVTIRYIKPEDNTAMAAIIRASLTQYGLNKPGTVYYDNTTDHLYELFQRPRAVYYIAETGNRIVGGAGIYPSDGLPENVCELSKMYVHHTARGMGIGSRLLNECMAFAAGAGYTTVYLESMPELTSAISMYSNKGFMHLQGPMGNTGHYFCTVWMQKQL